MTTSIDPALITRLSGEFTALGTQMGVLGRDLDLLHAQLLGETHRAASGVSPVPAPLAGPGTRPERGPRSAGSPGAAADVPNSTVGSADSGTSAASGTSGVSAERGASTGTGGIAASGAPTGHDATSAPGASGDTALPGGATRPGRDSTTTPVSPVVPGTPNEPGAAGSATVPGAASVPAAAAARNVAAGASVAASSQTPPAPAPWPGQGAQVQGYGAVPPGTAVPTPHGGMATPPYGPGQSPRWGAPVGPPPGWRPPVPPVRKAAVARTPWWQREGVISRVLAIAGVGVTLIGVVMLLVLAAQAGYFGPVLRVGAGAVFSAVLVGAGMRVFGRAGGRVGGIALAATGIAGAYLDVVAVTAIYDWLHPVLGLAVALAVAAGGVALAMEWKSQPLAVLVVAGAAALSPVVTSELMLLGFLIVLQLACAPVQLVRNWPVLHVVRTLPAVLATLGCVAIATFDDPAPDRVNWLLTAAIAIAVIGLVTSVLVVRGRPSDVIASLAFAMATTPLLAMPVLFERRAAALVAAIYAAVLLALAAAYLSPKLRAVLRIPGHTATVAAIAGAFALLEVCFRVTDVRTAPIALLLVAIGFLGVAGQVRSRVAAAIGGAFAALGAFGLLVAASPNILATQRLAQENLDISTVLAAVLALAVVAVAVWGIRKLPTMSSGDTEESMLWIVAAAVALYAVTVTTVSIGVASGAADGFVIGHCAATILWMVGATAALLYGLRNLSRSAAVAKVALGSGLLVTAAALVKLFLFDLATLDGLFRVAVFLVVGVLLLVVGTRYARAFAEAGATRDRDGEEVR
ncbi:DUF2339 domain-containing protein [Nocardia sp. NBC_01377]|uniref:DUF2339 domain-containing protein n=1 Tax=Nocardia sp. NBC_01377 TaxID=2903595 RepID=UPI00324FFA23